MLAKLEKKQEKKEKKQTTLQNCDCCYLIPLNEAGEKSELAIEVNSKDKYAPRKTGVYNIALRKWAKEAPDGDANKLAQQWKYDRKQRAFFSVAHPAGAIFEGFNKNLIVYKYRSMKNQKFLFDLRSKTFYNAFTHRALQLKSNDWESTTNVVTDKINIKLARQRWAVEQC